MNINKKLATIQTEFKSKKSRFNSFGKYYFRSAEDILEAIKPFLKELGVTVVVTEMLISQQPPILQTTVTLSDETASVQANAVVGVDMNQKGMQVPQKFGTASSYGKKYALGNLFLIDDTQDSDATNTHGNNGAIKQKLTKRTLTLDMAEFDKAKEYLLAGGKLDTIKKKYKMDKDTEDHLTMNTGARIETHEEA